MGLLVNLEEMVSNTGESPDGGCLTRVHMVKLMKECLCLQRVRDVRSSRVTEGPGCSESVLRGALAKELSGFLL